MSLASRSDDRSLIKTLTAVLINVVMGVIYVWGMFLLPLEAELGLARSELSLVPALALLTFTGGMVVHAGILDRIGALPFAVLAFALAAGGHLLFGLFPGYWSLLVGYGLLFGTGSGLGYGLALATVTTVASRVRSIAIGCTMAAFAAAGIILPLLLGPIVRSAAPSYVFVLIGLSILVAGTAVLVLLTLVSAKRTPGQASERMPAPSMRGRDLLLLGVAFFAICFVGLLAISQAAGMTSANGLGARDIDICLGLLTAGYLFGSLFGGRLVDAISGSMTLVVAAALSAIGIWLLDVPSAIAAAIGAASVGMAFGASASFMPIMIGERFGVERIGVVYGRLMAAYGLAGLLAPWLSGWIFEQQGGYRTSIIIAIALCACAVLIGLLMGRPTTAARTGR